MQGRPSFYRERDDQTEPGSEIASPCKGARRGKGGGEGKREREKEREIAIGRGASERDMVAYRWPWHSSPLEVLNWSILRRHPLNTGRRKVIGDDRTTDRMQALDKCRQQDKLRQSIAASSGST